MTRGAALLSACLVSASLAQAGPRAVEQGPARSPVTEVPSLAPAAANGDGFSLTTGPNALIGAPPLAIVAPTPSALSIERAAAATPLVEPPPGAVPAPPAAPIPTWTPAPTQAPPKPSPTVASEEAPKIGGEPLQAELGAFQHAAAQGGAKVGARFDGSESVSASAELELSRLAGDMNGRGFGSVSAAHFAPPSLARAVAELYGSWAAKSEGTSASRAIEFYDANRHVEWGSPDAPAALTADVRRLMEGLLAALQARFDKEGLYLGQVELRFVRNDLP
ncbi:MAG TPA: hypothetical protein VNI01_10470, partial [Elusimicrobiota bacterium]|nr:hypothetical protein [Elusimicrobiota bacterium]